MAVAYASDLLFILGQAASLTQSQKLWARTLLYADYKAAARAAEL